MGKNSANMRDYGEGMFISDDEWKKNQDNVKSILDGTSHATVRYYEYDANRNEFCKEAFEVRATSYTNHDIDVCKDNKYSDWIFLLNKKGLPHSTSVLPGIMNTYIDNRTNLVRLYLIKDKLKKRDFCISAINKLMKPLDTNTNICTADDILVCRRDVINVAIISVTRNLYSNLYVYITVKDGESSKALLYFVASYGPKTSKDLLALNVLRIRHNFYGTNCDCIEFVINTKVNGISVYGDIAGKTYDGKIEDYERPNHKDAVPTSVLTNSEVMTYISKLPDDEVLLNVYLHGIDKIKKAINNIAKDELM